MEGVILKFAFGRDVPLGILKVDLRLIDVPFSKKK